MLIFELVAGVNPVGRREASYGVSSNGSAEEQDVWLRLVNLVVDPASALLDSKVTKTYPRARHSFSESSLPLVMRLKRCLGSETCLYS